MTTKEKANNTIIFILFKKGQHTVLTVLRQIASSSLDIHFCLSSASRAKRRKKPDLPDKIKRKTFIPWK